jgi:hypothetical protein
MKISANRQRNNVDTVVTKGVIFGKALSSSLVSVCVCVLVFERDKRDCEVEEEEALRDAAPTYYSRCFLFPS